MQEKLCAGISALELETVCYARKIFTTLNVGVGGGVSCLCQAVISIIGGKVCVLMKKGWTCRAVKSRTPIGGREAGPLV